MAEQYSELEVAPHEHAAPLPEVVDQAAHAPERDLSGDSPELDKKAWPLQVRCSAEQNAHIASLEFNFLTSRLPEPLPYLRDSCLHTL